MAYTFRIRPYRIRIGFRVQKYGTVLYEPYPYKGRIIRPVSVYGTVPSPKLRKWVTKQNSIKQEKIIERRDIANQRESMLLEKLREKGYGDTDFRFCYDSLDLQAKWRRLMRYPRPFTDSLWDKIEPQLDALIAERRALRAAYKGWPCT
ncbi:uncharacterized protein FOMMEDRAFT_162113 [Fomitiporia mediterranea MF3/22]|uniref:uncharacterized protein n=1 Tax=Fomitiporia mediterranea (strain MF3/22) TaxID=694068 RepID=UPI0004407DE8|nr:uncharacterized protein FOMMEDRAFT_162113 [Fomitiporia mediterranea MF3/22]EJC98316.1 hypothetical protein FOMMEDRAFT_162113 [Fomitiporia mediterranea MF3/22]